MQTRMSWGEDIFPKLVVLVVGTISNSEGNVFPFGLPPLFKGDLLPYCPVVHHSPENMTCGDLRHEGTQ
jgi:hypothetical protein